MCVDEAILNQGGFIQAQGGSAHTQIHQNNTILLSSIFYFYCANVYVTTV